MAKVQVSFIVDLPTSSRAGGKRRITLPMLKEKVAKALGRDRDLNIANIRASHLEMYAKPPGWRHTHSHSHSHSSHQKGEGETTTKQGKPVLRLANH